MRHICTSLLLLLVRAALSAADPEAPDAALAAARAALDLEHQRAALLASWERERGDLERLASARGIALEAADAQLVELRARLAARATESARLAGEAAGLAADREAVQGALAGLAALLAAVPGAAPVGGAADAPLLERLHAAAAALEAARSAAARWDAEIAEGVRPDGTVLAVQVLKAGYAAAWYASLDGAQAGTAQRAGARWTLHPLDDPAAALAIGSALAQLRGNSVPETVLLPPPEAQAPAGPSGKGAP